MISYHKGDLLSSGCKMICHQVNIQGVFGGGLARAIGNKYPEVEAKYKEFEHKELGRISFAKAHDGTIIANVFSQDYDFNTSYRDLRNCAYSLYLFAKINEIKTTGIPYKYGCGIANGDWYTVETIFITVFCDTDIDLQIWRL